MSSYIAKAGECATFLTKDEQLDKSLELGCSIYEVAEDETETLIATPEDGFLTERPELEKKQGMEQSIAAFSL